MKHSQIRFLDQKPYIMSSIKCEYSEAIPKKAKNYIDFLNQHPTTLTNTYQSEQKLEKAKMIRFYNHSEQSEHLPRIKQNKDQSNIVISERNSGSLMKVSLHNSNAMVQKYSIFEAHYSNGISSGKLVKPVKLQKMLWKQSLEYLLKSHQG